MRELPMVLVCKGVNCEGRYPGSRWAGFGVHGSCSFVVDHSQDHSPCHIDDLHELFVVLTYGRKS